MTKKETARLVRMARTTTFFNVSATEKKFFCPLDLEAKRRDFNRELAHTFTVHHLPWEKGTDVKAVTDALLHHLDPDAEECVHANPFAAV